MSAPRTAGPFKAKNRTLEQILEQELPGLIVPLHIRITSITWADAWHPLTVGFIVDKQPP